jgi:hypothetical protein
MVELLLVLKRNGEMGIPSRLRGEDIKEEREAVVSRVDERK